MNEDLKSGDNGAPPQAPADNGAQASDQGARPAATSRPLPDDALIILPVRNAVMFPALVIPLAIGRERSRAAAQEAVRLERPIGVLLQSRPDIEEPGPDDLHWVGTSAGVLRYITTPDGVHHAVVKGMQRFRVLQFLDGWPFPVARVQYIEEAAEGDTEIEGRARALKQRAVEILELLPQVPEEMVTALQGVEGAARLADFIAGLMDIPAQEKQALLETFDLKSRLDKLLDLLAHRIEVLKVSREIDERTRESVTDANRKHLLREQMRQIQKELGEGDEGAAEMAELDKAITEAKMPEEVDKVARKELKRLERMPEAAGEYSMVRTYLEWLTELPWSNEPGAAIDIAEARRILDEDHFGLEKIKKRILEYLAVRKLNPTGRSPILCFVGPPGVGKTSLGQSIAKATGRKFVRVSLGGVHDEAEIRGHRRTYIGALPGNVIQSMRKVGTRHSVMMFDEVDKLGAGGFHGDPSSALLEVLDPEQNSTFRDNYLAVPYDLSQVMFICTANVLDTIPPPLRDRMEIIQLPGYTAQEKLEIARRYLIPRQLTASGLAASDCEITDEALRAIIDDYTRESGVRNLEREIGHVFRNAALRIAEGKERDVRIDPEDLPAILGARKFEAEVAMRTGVPGVATGLAWTPVGGDILFIEAARTPGGGRLILTGQLGDVMKESGQAALSLVKGRAASLGIAAEALEKSDIHIHVPAGATPKDGPSAGVAMFVALASLLTGRPVRNDVAMTGEISLRGLVLPIGGVKEKVLAALR
ncbi:MAG TPA: endopeptidase La, partial [Casimicrobiaceae bacterium]|nr:endopeptidase La [Casimicrobiaceae bacterium]